MKKQAVLILLLTFTIINVVYSNWPQYLGLERNGVSSEKGLKRSWPAGGPEVLWTFPLGEGFAGPATSAGKVYILDRVQDKNDVLRCIDIVTGKEEWNYSYSAPGKVSHPGSRTVPAVDGNFIYTCGVFGHVLCVSKTTHIPVWQKNIWKDFGGSEKYPNWGIAQNPLIYKDLLILAAQTENTGVVAFDKQSGQVRWKTPKLPGKPSYMSPAVINIQGEDHLVMASAGSRPPDEERQKKKKAARPQRSASAVKAEGAVIGMDPKTGKILWTYTGWQCAVPVANVTAIGDGRLFICGGYKSGSAMFKVMKEGSKYIVTELYTTMDFGTHIHPPILYKDHLYAQCSDNTGRRDGMVCMDLDGRVKWKTMSNPFFDKGGAVLADGMMLALDGIDGILYLIEPDPEKFKRLASAKLLDTKKCWAPLVLDDGKLLIRDLKQMKCVQVK